MRTYFFLIVLFVFSFNSAYAQTQPITDQEDWYQAYLDCVKRNDPGCKVDPLSAPLAPAGDAVVSEIWSVNDGVNMYMAWTDDRLEYQKDEYWISGQARDPAGLPARPSSRSIRPRQRNVSGRSALSGPGLRPLRFLGYAKQQGHMGQMDPEIGVRNKSASLAARRLVFIFACGEFVESANPRL